jgi:hypothetical protein
MEDGEGWWDLREWIGKKKELQCRDGKIQSLIVEKIRKGSKMSQKV